MESLRGPINSFFFEEGMNSECLESGPLSICSAINTSDGGLIPRHHYQQMPFLQMLHGAMQAEEEAEEEKGELRLQLRRQEQALFNPYPAESNLQLLLRLQDQRHCSQNNWAADIESTRPAVDQHDSCITHASESQSDGKGADHVLPCLGDAAATAAAPVTTGRKRRKRPRAAAAAAAPSKKAEEVESQRMNHIAVERNRRRLMNDHLVALRSLMPPSFVQRGDQASIIGGAIDFVKELEQHLHSLQAEKRMRTTSAAATSSAASSPCTTLSRSSEDDACHAAQPTTDYLHGGFFVAPQYTTYSRLRQRRGEASTVEEVDEGVDVEATVVQGHVNLKVAGRRREGQLVRAIAAMEELRLSVLHLNITSLDPASILYSLNLKMEDGCKLGSADEIATAVHQIFAYITAC